jgi:mycothiol system anti-sigma-R factor
VNSGVKVPHPSRRAPLDCDTVLARLHRHIDRSLGAAESGEIDSHLETCPACQDELRVAHGMVALLRRSCAERAPDHLRDRVSASIAALREKGAAASV